MNHPTKSSRMKSTYSRKPKYTNANQRRKFTSRFQRKVKDFYDQIAINEMLEEDFDNQSNEPQPLIMPQEIENHITQTHTTQIFSDGRRQYKVNIPPTLLHTSHPTPIKFYQKAIVQFDLNNETIYHSILNHSIN